MGDEDDRLLQLALQAQELVLHLAPDQRIESAERLVEEPDSGLTASAAGDADPLLLAARELRGDAVAPAQADELDDFAGARLALGPGHALDREGKGDIVEHAEMRQQREVLEDHAHLVPAELDQLALRR